jgi:hypothetical protein
MPPNLTQKQNLFNFVICPECNQRFPQHETFNAHFEKCWVEAVEKEHRQLLLEKLLKLNWPIPLNYFCLVHSNCHQMKGKGKRQKWNKL